MEVLSDVSTSDMAKLLPNHPFVRVLTYSRIRVWWERSDVRDELVAHPFTHSRFDKDSASNRVYEAK